MECSTVVQTPSVTANFSENKSQCYYNGLQGLIQPILAAPLLIWSHFLLPLIHLLHYSHSKKTVTPTCYSHHLKRSFPSVHVLPLHLLTQLPSFSVTQLQTLRSETHKLFCLQSTGSPSNIFCYILVILYLREYTMQRDFCVL